MTAAPSSAKSPSGQPPRPEFVKLTPEEVTARKRRNLALAGALVAFIVLVFVTTVLNLQRNVAAREAAEAALAPAVAAPVQPQAAP